MPASDNERVTCPSCGKRYRWQADLIGRQVTCKQCGEGFVVPDAPGPGVAITPEPAVDDGTYELDFDALNEPEAPPPAFKPQAAEHEAPIDEHQPPAPVIDTSADKPDAQNAPGGEPSDQEAYVSEATKAARREEQRIAAAANEPQRKWWQQKWLVVVVGLLILLGLIYWVMLQFSDAMDEGLHNTMKDDPYQIIVISRSYGWGFSDE
ncbi:MAG: hypothetical protein AAGI37_10265 [Planctomycetota bacterium]